VTRCAQIIAQNVAQPLFLSKLTHNSFFREKSCPKVWAVFIFISKKLPKVNDCSEEENSHNQVTLIVFEIPESLGLGEFWSSSPNVLSISSMRTVTSWGPMLKM
jgi:hypothetical protein